MAVGFFFFKQKSSLQKSQKCDKLPLFSGIVVFSNIASPRWISCITGGACAATRFAPARGREPDHTPTAGPDAAIQGKPDPEGACPTTSRPRLSPTRAGLLALDSCSRVVDICRMQEVCDQPACNRASAFGTSRGWRASWRATKAGLGSS